MGFGKLAISMIMICILGFAIVSAFSMAQSDTQTSAAPYDNQSNVVKTAQLANVAGSTSATLFIPLVIISGILFLAGAFYVFKRHPVL